MKKMQDHNFPSNQYFECAICQVFGLRCMFTFSSHARNIFCKAEKNVIKHKNQKISILNNWIPYVSTTTRAVLTIERFASPSVC